MKTLKPDPNAFVLASLTCNKCGFETSDQGKMQEFLVWEDTAGYLAEVYEDGDVLTLELCEDCKYNLLFKYIKVESNYKQDNFDRWQDAQNES